MHTGQALTQVQKGCHQLKHNFRHKQKANCTGSSRGVTWRASTTSTVQVQAGVINSPGTGTGQARVQATQVQVQAPAELLSSTDLGISAGRGSNGTGASTGASKRTTSRVSGRSASRGTSSPGVSPGASRNKNSTQAGQAEIGVAVARVQGKPQAEVRVAQVSTQVPAGAKTVWAPAQGRLG